jgi:uncharacterized 2Fe-2S/4Fe-4S cluster protein (DUF4445 family)
MGVAPFTPVFLDQRVISAGHAMPQGLDVRCYLLSGAAAYIGSDLAAGALASGLLYDDGPSLLVDAGTNGEIILKHDGRLWGCATAAGPAFEGAGLSCGIRAGAGAISHIAFDTDPFAVRTQVIQSASVAGRPLGLCGSAYVDLLARGRRIGLLTPTGKFDTDAVAGARAHVIERPQNDRALRIARGQGGGDIVVSQRDIAALLQAKAAVAAGILTLLERNRLEPRDVRRVYLAGGFGTHMDADSAIGCGLLPGFAPAQVQPVGNTALAGAFLAIMDSGCMAEIRRAARGIHPVELNQDPGFEARYIDQLWLP